MTIQNLLTVFSPSLKISMTFLKLLVEHQARIFAQDVPTIADRRGNDRRLTLLPDFVLTSDTVDHDIDIGSSEVPTAPEPSPKIATSDKTKFSTPIADKFARGPVEISFREPSPQPPNQ
jgi:hypothetical protein